ncbi:S-adenosyl-L-methionine-dependent methyltransferase [Calocera cornea HHB12733]|uniref:S-adenosyl-L-methionine-dependent methyltransferase n=1 Tax=Calocera cornea HHB12733 TaxID=1353952 RepID=A0A165DI09_9BASI|nr:S-adenosyl-L-methionine-dependent methyltransferase [Calocera cornea HHB12733]
MSTSVSKYTLITDEPEGQRLNRQHAALKKLFDDQLLPDGLELKGGDWVLDSGTGTGVWAIDLASALPPTVQIDCIDLTTRLFPRGNEVPANLHFSTGNALALPEEAQSKYTLIHQRFLSGAFGNSDWHTCLGQLWTALRPGGWLKLEELYGRITPSLPRSTELMRISLELETKRGIDFAAVEKLPEWIGQAGFEDVRVDSRKWILGPGEERAGERAIFLGAWRAIRAGVTAAGYDMGMPDQAWETFVQELEAELDANEAGLVIYSFEARKPL